MLRGHEGLAGNALTVHTPEGRAGVISRDANGYVFGYDNGVLPQQAVSLTMPVRARPYEWARLLPVFQMNLPEGFLLERLRLRLAKTSGTEPLLLLALLGGENAVGRLRFAVPEASARAAGTAAHDGEKLSAILAYRGAEGLFDSLVERYLLRSGLSGVQPKVLVPLSDDGVPGSVAAKASARTQDLIVKSGLSEFPGLAVNEFLCMTIAARAGMPVPEFHLSDDRQLFVMQRFDRTPRGEALGFEDMAVLAGRDAADKYVGSYAQVAKLVQAFCAPEHRVASLRNLFDIVALSCLVGNGDAHLKNFGVLYDSPLDPTGARLAPAYDIVNTTCYLPQDSLALDLGGSRSLFASRLTLLDFATTCLLSKRQAQQRIAALIAAAHDVLFEFDELAGGVPGFRESVGKRLGQFTDTFGSR